MLEKNAEKRLLQLHADWRDQSRCECYYVHLSHTLSMKKILARKVKKNPKYFYLNS